MTYAELKTRLEEMTPNQLAMDVIWSGDCRGGDVVRLDVLTEDHIDPSGDGMEPVSPYADDPELVKSEAVVARAGQALLVVDE